MSRARPLIRMLGRQRARAAVVWLALIAICLAAAGLLLHLGLEPMLAKPGRIAGLGQADLIRAHAVLQALLTLLIAFIFWRQAAVRPLRALRGSLRRHLSRKRGGGSGGERMRALEQESEKRSGQLNAVLQMNRGMRDRVAKLAQEQQAVLRTRDAVLNTIQDAVLLTDGTGTVVGVSPATATLLRCPRESLIGKRFDDVAPLFQDGREQFRDYPLRNFLGRVLGSGSGIPQIQEAVLVNHENEPVPVFVTAGAIVDSSGQALGSTVRFSRADAPPSDETQKPTLSLSEAEMHDWGSKLLSREPFERRLDELIAEARATGARHMLLYLRVDDLDRINDQSGYWAGEQALWHAAKNFAMSLVDAGTGYRYSNSRLGALLIGYDETRALEVAERVRKYAEENPLIWNGERIVCTFSIAVVPIDRETTERTALLGAAENLLSQAKQRGGNRTLHKTPDEAVTTRRRDDQTWLEWLLPRLDSGRAHLISQELRSLTEPPQRPMVEFFIRVEDDDGVWLEPGYYLPAIERLHQSHRVDLWTLQNLLDALGGNSRLLETHAVVSLNLAPQSLLEPSFAPSAFEIIGTSTVPPDRLCFEIDEAFAVSQSSVVQRFMEQLRPTGVRFALDRCHTTMGITQLRHLPVDYMKIHPSVTRSIESDALDRTHLEWICEAAHLLGRKTAAINIESEAALTLLRAAGVDYVQGSAVNKIGPLMT